MLTLVGHNLVRPHRNGRNSAIFYGISRDVPMYILHLQIPEGAMVEETAWEVGTKRNLFSPKISYFFPE